MKKDFFSPLSQKDVDLLLKNSSSEVRSSTAIKVSQQYQKIKMSEKERKIAEDIFRLIANDVELQVREDLSQSLKECSFLPQDIVQKIIYDVSKVAVPFLKYLDAISDSDLIKILQTKDEAKQCAVAQRKTVSPIVCASLVNEGGEKPVALLASNYGAQISEKTYETMFEKFKQSTSVQIPLLVRPQVPLSIIEKLITKVSDELKKTLLTQKNLPQPLVTVLVSHVREKAILSLSETSTDYEIKNFVLHLHKENKLFPQFLLRAACLGDMKFFEYAMAVKAGIPVRNARILIYDSGLLGLERIYRESKMPKELFAPISLAVHTFQQMLEESEDGYKDHFQRRLLERLMMLFDEYHIAISSEDESYFLKKISQNKSMLEPASI